MIPTIAILTFNGTEYKLRSSYVDAVRRAGGLPVLLPPGEPNVGILLERVDAVLLAGGGDVEPCLYGGSDHPAIYGVDWERDGYDLAWAQLALESGTPILGICRGMQLLGVGGGASLVTHIPEHYGSSILHRLELESGDFQQIPHEVFILPNSKLGLTMGTKNLLVESWHHQSLQEAPKGWNVVAYSSDGVIEAIECPDHRWAIGLQWHPELSPDKLDHHKIFQSFVEAASARFFSRWKKVYSFSRS